MKVTYKNKPNYSSFDMLNTGDYFLHPEDGDVLIKVDIMLYNNRYYNVISLSTGKPWFFGHSRVQLVKAELIVETL